MTPTHENIEDRIGQSMYISEVVNSKCMYILFVMSLALEGEAKSVK